jgi:hypothetical protein
VAPTHRRRRVLRTLDGLAEISRRMGVTELMLWVLESNYAADSAFRALGFEPTGDRQYLAPIGQFERRLRREIKRHESSEPTELVLGFDCRISKLGVSPGVQL